MMFVEKKISTQMMRLSDTHVRTEDLYEAIHGKGTEDYNEALSRHNPEITIQQACEIATINGRSDIWADLEKYL